MREIADHVEKFRRIRLIDLACAIGRQDHLVRIPVGEEIGQCRDDEGDDHAALPANEVADGHEDGGKSGEEDGRAEEVEHWR
ncbi:hypothetical protein D3C72_2169590 [compost metagenome]